MSSKKAINNFRKLIKEDREYTKNKQLKKLDENIAYPCVVGENIIQTPESKVDESSFRDQIRGIVQGGRSVMSRAEKALGTRKKELSNSTTTNVPTSPENKEELLPNISQLVKTTELFTKFVDTFVSKVKEKVLAGKQAYTVKEAREGDPEFGNWQGRYDDPVDNVLESIEMHSRGLKKDILKLTEIIKQDSGTEKPVEESFSGKFNVTGVPLTIVIPGQEPISATADVELYGEPDDQAVGAPGGQSLENFEIFYASGAKRGQPVEDEIVNRHVDHKKLEQAAIAKMNSEKNEKKELEENGLEEEVVEEERPDFWKNLDKYAEANGTTGHNILHKIFNLMNNGHNEEAMKFAMEINNGIALTDQQKKRIYCLAAGEL